MPSVMRELHKLDCDYLDGEGIDFEPYPEFLSGEETRSWIQAWTGNKAIDGSEFLVFGQDGTGGYAAFWCIRPNASILDQPICFLGSEGELGMVAQNFAAYVWLLAGGFGPSEAADHRAGERLANQDFTAFALAHAPGGRKAACDIVAAARAEFPAFEEFVRSLCR